MTGFDECSAAVLAGGRSRRMGFNKALIEVDGTTIIARTVGLLRERFDDVFIVAGDPLVYESIGCAVVADVVKDAGSLGGIHTALFHARCPRVFVTACDMPFLAADVIGRVVEAGAAAAADAVVPYIDGRLHPMHALYSKKCLEAVESMIRAGNLRVMDLFERVRTRTLDEADFKGLAARESVGNVNTPEDLERAGLAVPFASPLQPPHGRPASQGTP
ncbi:MAG TPA: molybdenum cofactor guanylyltransferase [Deltaproteobacteria bacterium]|nr:molybdenum cofactor guanylyltransferase [Deltaproteobacteria bacterium]